MCVCSLGCEDPLEEGLTTHSSVLFWRIPWTEEPAVYSPWGPKELDTTEATYHSCVHIPFIMAVDPRVSFCSSMFVHNTLCSLAFLHLSESTIHFMIISTELSISYFIRILSFLLVTHISKYWTLKET